MNGKVGLNRDPLSTTQAEEARDPPMDEEDLENATTKWLFTTEFNHMFKKLERVKDNFSTHKKFMDIVKLLVVA